MRLSATFRRAERMQATLLEQCSKVRHSHFQILCHKCLNRVFVYGGAGCAQGLARTPGTLDWQWAKGGCSLLVPRTTAELPAGLLVKLPSLVVPGLKLWDGAVELCICKQPPRVGGPVRVSRTCCNRAHVHSVWDM